MEQATNQVQEAFEAIRDVTSSTNEKIAVAERKQKASTVCDTLGIEQDQTREFIMESSTMSKLRRSVSQSCRDQPVSRPATTTIMRFALTDSTSPRFPHQGEGCLWRRKEQADPDRPHDVPVH